MTDQKTYTCEACGGTFHSEQTDEEAEAEMLKLEGYIPPEERAVICDDCYQGFQEFMARKKTAH